MWLVTKRCLWWCCADLSMHLTQCDVMLCHVVTCQASSCRWSAVDECVVSELMSWGTEKVGTQHVLDRGSPTGRLSTTTTFFTRASSHMHSLDHGQSVRLCQELVSAFCCCQLQRSQFMLGFCCCVMMRGLTLNATLAKHCTGMPCRLPVLWCLCQSLMSGRAQHNVGIYHDA
jgi:hypothetical protein